MSSRVVHVRDNVPDAIYVGRPNSRVPSHLRQATEFGNPFKPETRTARAHTYAVGQYMDYLKASPALLRQLPMLRDRPLACWCRHDGESGLRCHADVLVQALKTCTDEQLLALADDVGARGTEAGE